MARPAQDIDIRSATGRLIEQGTSLAFTVTLAPAPAVPDAQGHPFRVDVLMRDPRLPAYSFGPYHDVNRILRFDATEPPRATLLLLPEHGQLTPSTYDYSDGTVTFTVAGRLLGEERGIQPFDPSPIRWSVLARDEDRCDRLGGAGPSLRLTGEAESLAAQPGGSRTGNGTGFLWPLLGASAAVGLFLALAGWRRRRSR